MNPPIIVRPRYGRWLIPPWGWRLGAFMSQAEWQKLARERGWLWDD